MSIVVQTWHTNTVCGMKGTGKTTLEFYLLPKYPRVLVFDPNGEFPEFERYVPRSDKPDELDHVCETIWKQGNVCLLVSEAEVYLPVYGGLGPNVFKCITRGRHRNIGLIFDTRRIANLNKTAFGLSEHCFIFRHFSPTDLRYLGEFLPDVSMLPKLPDYNFLHYSNGLSVICTPVPKIMKKGVHHENRSGSQINAGRDGQKDSSALFIEPT